jgi:hypothetical protein
MRDKLMLAHTGATQRGSDAHPRSFIFLLLFFPSPPLFSLSLAIQFFFTLFAVLSCNWLFVIFGYSFGCNS